MNLLLIIFGILKVFIIIVAIILFVLGLVLFVPIKYYIAIDLAKNLNIIIKVSWLLKFITAEYYFKENKDELNIKIIGINIGKKKSDKKNEQKNNSLKEEVKSEIKTEPEAKATYEEQANPEEVVDETVGKIIEERKKIFNIIKDLYNKFKLVVEYSDRDKVTQLTKKFLKNIYVVIKSRVKIFRFYGELGFKQPSSTGYAFGVINIAKVFMKMDIDIKPNFEKDVVDIKFSTKGKFTIWSILWAIIKYIKERTIWKLLKKFFFNRKDER